MEVTWQQTSKHINKSINCEYVSTYRSQCIAVSGEIGRGRRNFKFLVPAFYDVALFQVVKVTFRREKFLIFEDRAWGE